MAQIPITTIIPFNDVAKLPNCAKACGPLYDANGACVPPAAPQAEPAAYTTCLCRYSKLSPFATATAGVCDQACTAEPEGMKSITNWYKDICKDVATVGAGGGNGGNGGNGAGNGGNQPDTGDDSGGSTGGSRSGNSGKGGDWLSNHWQWVVMLVVLVVGIAAIWVGACLWRRRYLRKKDRQTLSQKPATAPADGSWGPGIGHNSNGNGPDSAVPYKTENRASLPTFVTTSEEKRKSKKEKKRWIVSERT